MQLRVARICLDCDEVHDAQCCPLCSSEAFAYLTRWVPAPERRVRPRPTTSPEAEVYRQLIAPASPATHRGWLSKRNALGITAIALAGWVWRRNEGRKNADREGAQPQRAQHSEPAPTIEKISV